MSRLIEIFGAEVLVQAAAFAFMIVGTGLLAWSCEQRPPRLMPMGPHINTMSTVELIPGGEPICVEFSDGPVCYRPVHVVETPTPWVRP